jgi:serine protease Do
MILNPQTAIIVCHLSGSKINQVEHILLNGVQEVTIGRDPSSGIAYDGKRDDVVSRRHAAIRIEDGEKLAFRLVDFDSSNGTLLNGERITGEVELAPEDTIELGRGGPKFAFDVQPRPDYLASRTRVMNAVDASATRAMATATGTLEVPVNGNGTKELGATTSVENAVPSKPAVGKETVLRMLFQERQKSSRVLKSSVAAVLAVLLVGGGSLYWHNRVVASQIRDEAHARRQHGGNAGLYGARAASRRAG